MTIQPRNPAGKRSVAVIGAGLHGLITAKTLVHDPDQPFDNIVVYERSSEAGGVWTQDRIYDGLTTNSPLLTYEIPGFRYPKTLRKVGVHVRAQDVRKYLHDYAETYDVNKRIRYNTDVQHVDWNAEEKLWILDGRDDKKSFRAKHSHIVICTGLYHTPHSPLPTSQISNFSGQIWHSSQIGSRSVQRSLSESKNVVVIGAGKSALDISTLIAQGTWQKASSSSTAPPPTVTLVYRKPHWISPRKILRGSIPFEKVLFSRFVNAWLPYVRDVDGVHRFVTRTRLGRLMTDMIFSLVTDDFVKSNGQVDLSQTIPEYPLKQALSGALHVEPPRYFDLVKEGKISIVKGRVQSLGGDSVSIETLDGQTLVQKADTVILATGYKLALPFFTPSTLKSLGLINPSTDQIDPSDLPYIHLHRLIVPPTTLPLLQIPTPSSSSPPQNIAFNGFAYSLLNPLIAHVTAHWIADYFSSSSPFCPPIRLSGLSQPEVENEITTFHAWQTATFGAHGAKGVHIGNHATLYADELLADMGVSDVGHVEWKRWWEVWNVLSEWWRPMMPDLYSGLGERRRLRNKGRRSRDKNQDGEVKEMWEHVELSQGGVLDVKGWNWNACWSVLLGLVVWTVSMLIGRETR